MNKKSFLIKACTVYFGFVLIMALVYFTPLIYALAANRILTWVIDSLLWFLLFLSFTFIFVSEVQLPLRPMAPIVVGLSLLGAVFSEGLNQASIFINANGHLFNGLYSVFRHILHMAILFLILTKAAPSYYIRVRFGKNESIQAVLLTLLIVAGYAINAAGFYSRNFLFNVFSVILYSSISVVSLGLMTYWLIRHSTPKELV